MTRARRRWSRRGQALVETAIAAPILVMLLLGGAQVGQIAYAQVSLDTAAREGAAAAAAAPNGTAETGGANWYPGSSTHICTGADFTGVLVNPACVAVYNSGGFLDPTQFANGNATVTITVKSLSGLAALKTQSLPARLDASQQSIPIANSSSSSFPCNKNNQALITGQVTGMPSGSTATLHDSNNDTYKGPTVSASSPTYQYCVAATSSVTSQIVSAAVGPACGPSSYSGATSSISVQAGNTYSSDIPLSAVSCPSTSTTTDSSTTTTTSTTSSTTSTTTATTSVTSGPSVVCHPDTIPSDEYITVTVTYPVPIFVPFINGLFQTASGVRTISTSVTYAIYPCHTTNGN